MIQVDISSFTYPGKSGTALQNVRLGIDPGECVLITGPTGCGKSTLLKCINGIIPHTSEGTLTGDVVVNGVNTKNASLPVLAKMVGLVQQNPDDQIFSLTVEDEVGFGPENLCLPIGEIEQRIDTALGQVGMRAYRKQSVNALSGGQKQRVVIASILAMQPDVLLLDEPASQLDPKGARDILSVIASIHSETRRTIVLVEHRIHEVAHLVNRVIVMDKGCIVLDADRDQVFKNHIDLFYRLGLRLPETIELFYQLELEGLPLTAEEALFALREEQIPGHPENGSPFGGSDPKTTEQKTTCPDSAVRMENIWFAYEDRNWILKGIDLGIRRGEIVALLGNNGSGKSTLLLHLCGILEPGQGDVSVFGRSIRGMRPESLVGEVSVVFQDPSLMLCCDTVWKEIAFGPHNMNMQRPDLEKSVQNALKVMTLEDERSRPPQSLSGGQRLRAAVASVLSMRPRMLLLDEPTSGQDRRNIIRFMEHLKFLSTENITTVFITHDMETALSFADRIIILDDGKIIADGDPREIFLDFDILNRTALQAPQSITLSTRLGLSPCLCVNDLARQLKPAVAHA
ncbi:ABC transporter ATP-binding protein [Desulfosarcina ovata subsp. sediminis]|uniref:ABC transporter ATP-binding protein n=1 Tax=Desulfosarcina ovata subsp. sediminis TaxID=885957 RepID=A0A5K7ZIB8_9BACT|nr:energy-coupling factor transporter ATPase [Desulfosarcina ovata]BBO81948.1 ABC transporter ATP-binding protein [Desulfosarcina ovata subsp. sediminis]